MIQTVFGTLMISLVEDRRHYQSHLEDFLMLIKFYKDKSVLIKLPLTENFYS